jgi:peptide/nickel transport system permease protein
MDIQIQTVDENKLTDKQIQSLEKVQPMWKIVFAQFLEHRMAVAGLIVICLFVLIALSAPIITKIVGIDPSAQNPLNRYLKPMSVAELPQDQKEDKILNWETANPEKATEVQNELIAKSMIPAEVAAADATYSYVLNNDLESLKQGLSTLESSGAKDLLQLTKQFQTLHIFGTDELGRDVMIRLIYGTRVSMGVGIMVAIASTLIGLLIGCLAGYYGGILDMALMRITDSMLSLPITPVLIVIAAIDLSKIPFFQSIVGSQNESIVKMVFILLIFSWMTVALLVRSNILSLREREFILAAKTLGAKDSTIILRHMVPNVIAPLLVSVTLGVGQSILFESALSFLGLGIQQPTPSWGNMLFNAQDLISEAPFLAILPGLMILFITMSFNYLGDGLQDAIDPKAIRR